MLRSVLFTVHVEPSISRIDGPSSSGADDVACNTLPQLLACPQGSHWLGENVGQCCFLRLVDWPSVLIPGYWIAHAVT